MREEIVISFLVYVIFTGLLSLAVTIVGVGPLIEYLKANYIGQYIREDGPQEHHSKKGTPTMGGIILLAGVLLSSIFVLFLLNVLSPRAIVALIAIAGFGLLGFSDDYLKVIKKHNKGVTGWTKLLFQGIFACIVVLLMYYHYDVSTVSLFGLYNQNLGILYVLFGIFVIVGSSNAVNLTDGLDGLASLTSAISFVTLAFFLYKIGSQDLAIIAVALATSCVGFLVYNYYPAKIFMGDSGSLMLGGAFGVLGVLGGLEFWLIPIGIIFVVEVFSVIIQVISFKSTGKRVFKMTPLHHHFELCGDKETTVVLKFFIVQAVFCILAVFAGYMWLF